MKNTLYLILASSAFLTGFSDGHCEKAIPSPEESAQTPSKESSPVTTKEGTLESLIYVTNETFEKEVLQADKPVLVDFYAKWCGPCRLMAPVYAETSKDYVGNVKFTKLDIKNWGHPKVKEYDIHSIPQLIMFRDGKEVTRQSGYMEKEELKHFIEDGLKK